MHILQQLILESTHFSSSTVWANFAYTVTLSASFQYTKLYHGEGEKYITKSEHMFAEGEYEMLIKQREGLINPYKASKMKSDLILLT